ncbi:MAG: GNAT family N-acetyltransferase [Rhodobacteraceae bacterium]|nr:GNAT family N-acetyltransferase [Paracoccaceae bacterium]
MSGAAVCVAPRRLGPEDPALHGVWSLLRTTFAYMEGRIDPPSSMHRMTVEDVAAQAAQGELWAVEEDGRVVACVFLTPRRDALYLGKLAVAVSHRGRGIARQLVALAERRAREKGLPAIELQSRVELAENHAAFAAMGFRVTAETAHPGFDRPTSLTFVKPI